MSPLSASVPDGPLHSREGCRSFLPHVYRGITCGTLVWFHLLDILEGAGQLVRDVEDVADSVAGHFLFYSTPQVTTPHHDLA